MRGGDGPRRDASVAATSARSAAPYGFFARLPRAARGSGHGRRRAQSPLEGGKEREGPASRAALPRSSSREPDAPSRHAEAPRAPPDVPVAFAAFGFVRRVFTIQRLFEGSFEL